MKYLKTFESYSVNEGKISQFVLGSIISAITAVSETVQKIKGTYVPLKLKDKKSERKLNKDLFKMLDYSVFDMMKYYFSKKYKEQANKSSLTELIKSRCGVDIYQLIEGMESSLKVENVDFSENPKLKEKQMEKYNKLLETLKNYKGLFKKIDDDIYDVRHMLDEINDLMKGLDPRVPKSKEEVLDNLDSGIKRLDKLQNPDPKNINDLLDKVHRYGIDSLTDQEKEDLDKHSKTI